jgi:hypothetical protein
MSQKEQALNRILQILHSIKEDETKLLQVLDFLEEKMDESESEIEIEIPAQFNEAVKLIASCIGGNLVCYLNLDTLEMEEMPREWVDDFSNIESMTGMSLEEMDFKHPEWENFIEFEPLNSSNQFRMMERFANQLEDKKMSSKIIGILSNRKPFANFNAFIHSSPYRQCWFDFKQAQLEYYVKEELMARLTSV